MYQFWSSIHNEFWNKKKTQATGCLPLCWWFWRPSIFHPFLQTHKIQDSFPVTAAATSQSDEAFQNYKTWTVIEHHKICTSCDASKKRQSLHNFSLNVHDSNSLKLTSWRRPSKTLPLPIAQYSISFRSAFHTSKT